MMNLLGSFCSVNAPVGVMTSPSVVYYFVSVIMINSDNKNHHNQSEKAQRLHLMLLSGWNRAVMPVNAPLRGLLSANKLAVLASETSGLGFHIKSSGQRYLNHDFKNRAQ